ncbi:MAG: aminotransferase class IV [Phycisphaerales bacterium]|nr:aminotransferase class IV [Phycisphaerales bacterium]
MTTALNDIHEYAVIDGCLTPAVEALIPATDTGFLRGDGAFEVLRSYGGIPFGLEEHIQRLLRSAAGIRLPEIDTRAIERDVAALIDARGTADFAIRIVVTRGGRRLVISEPLGDYPPAVRLAFVEFQPSLILDGFKTLSYAANMQANRIAQERGYDESLLVKPDGEVLESPTASLFWSPDGETLITPPLEGILASITRAVIVDALSVEQRVTTREELAGASEAFLCSSVREVQAVGEIEGRGLTSPGPLTAKSVEALAAAVQARVAAGAANSE